MLVEKWKLLTNLVFRNQVFLKKRFNFGEPFNLFFCGCASMHVSCCLSNVMHIYVWIPLEWGGQDGTLCPWRGCNDLQKTTKLNSCTSKKIQMVTSKEFSGYHINLTPSPTTVYYIPLVKLDLANIPVIITSSTTFTPRSPGRDLSH